MSPALLQVLFASKAWTVAEERYIHWQSRIRYIQVYNILVCTCLTISYQMICCANSSLDVATSGKPRLGGLSVEATEERRHAHMAQAECHKRLVETRRLRKAYRT